MFNVDKKLREAQFFLEKMRERERMAFGDPEVFDFLLKQAGKLETRALFRGKPRRNGRACGRQYLRSAICATQSKAPAPFDQDRANLDMRPRPAARGGELAGIGLGGGNPGALGFAAPRRSHE
jgi:hypothetical protein